jgi:hypothetical protein
MFVHTVFFWMKPGVSVADRQQTINDCREYLGKVPGVRQLWSGRPAQTPRDVVDNSYHAGLTVVFDDKVAHDAYQVAPLHHDFIKRNKENWQRVQVYDYVTD